MAENNTSYGNIFKTTFLFGFVQIFNIAVKVVLNKIVAIMLGAEGMGIIGIYNSVVNLIKTGASLGINQSAIRDISEANALNDKERFSRIISLINNIVFFTALLGIAVTILLSQVLSESFFGNYSYSLAFVWISLVVGINVLSEGQLAILKGMRQLRAMAYASMYGSMVGVVAAVPFYYFYGQGGIIPSLIITAFAALVLSNYYVRKIPYTRVVIGFKQCFKEASPILKMGIALMLVSFIGNLFDMLVAAFISRTGSIADVGLYNAGAAIITNYFGIVITAMNTDYYPRISGVHTDNVKLTEEMNKQSETGLVMIFPLVILFVFLSPVFIEILYSSNFYATNDYTDYAMIGTVIIVVSNCMGMILLAKQASNIFIWSVLGQRTILIGAYFASYHYWGLLGLGFAYIFLGIIHLVFMIAILHKFYGIHVATRVYKLLALIIGITLLTIFARKIDNMLLSYGFGIFLLLSSFLISYFYMKNKMDLDIIKIVKQKMKKNGTIKKILSFVNSVC